MKKTVILSLTALLCACSAFESKPKTKYVIETPYGFEEAYDDGMITPEVYALVATRATNRMLDQSSAVFEKIPNPKLYIMELKKVTETLPDGFYYSKKVTQDIIEGSRTFTKVNNLNDADYYLETEVREIVVNQQEAPIIEYKMTLFDVKNNKINEWTETIKQIQNDDRSWW